MLCSACFQSSQRDNFQMAVNPMLQEGKPVRCNSSLHSIHSNSTCSQFPLDYNHQQLSLPSEKSSISKEEGCAVQLELTLRPLPDTRPFWTLEDDFGPNVDHLVSLRGGKENLLQAMIDQCKITCVLVLKGIISVRKELIGPGNYYGHFL